jgi:hypothetical protein
MNELRDDVSIYTGAKAIITKYRLSNMFHNTIRKQRKIQNKKLSSKPENISKLNLSYGVEHVLLYKRNNDNRLATKHASKWRN